MAVLIFVVNVGRIGGGGVVAVLIIFGVAKIVDGGIMAVLIFVVVKIGGGGVGAG